MTARQAPGADAPEVVFSESCVGAIQSTCGHTDTIHGRVETHWIIFGVTRDDMLLGLHPLIPRTSSTMTTYRVSPADYSAVNREGALRFAGELPFLQGHRHPWPQKPVPSVVDQVNRDRTSLLLAPINRQVSVFREPLEAAVDDRGELRFAVDRLRRRVSILAGSASPETTLEWEETVAFSDQGFVIFNQSADTGKVYAEILRLTPPLTDDPEAPPRAVLFRDCRFSVLADEEAASLAGIPLEQVRRPAHDGDLRDVVKDRIRPSQWLASSIRPWRSKRLARSTATVSFRFLGEEDGTGEVGRLVAEAAGCLGVGSVDTHQYLVAGRTSLADLGQALAEAALTLTRLDELDEEVM